MESDSSIVDKFEIDPANYQRDRVYIGSLLVLSLLMLTFGVISYYNEFWIGASFALLMLTGVSGYLFSQRRRGDRIVVRDTGLQVHKTNPNNRGIFLGRDRPVKLTLENVDTVDGIESTPTFNLWAGERIMLGFWLSLEAKIEVAREFVVFLERNGFTVEYREDI